jgi:superfamily I DNA/RNA helicase
MTTDRELRADETPLARSVRQQRAVAACENAGIHVVLAGAGVGKTYTITEELIPALVARGKRIVAQTFTVRAEANLKRAHAHASSAQLSISTTMGFFWARYRRSHPAERWLQVTEAALRLAAFATEPSGERRRDALTVVRQRLEAPGALPPRSSAYDEEAIAAYEHHKRYHGLYEGPDVRDWILASLDTFPDELIREGYSVLLVDEFPDSAPEERAFIEACAAARLEVYLFGDICQTLYGSLRDANWEWPHRLVASGRGHRHYLDVSRRAAAGPLASANGFIEKFLSDYGGIPMLGVRPGGRELDGAVLPDEGSVLSALQRSVVTVMDWSRGAPSRLDQVGHDQLLAKRIGLPSRLRPGESVLFLTARDEDTRKTAEAVTATGLEIHALRRGDSKREHRAFSLLFAIVDPEAACARAQGIRVGTGDGICLVLDELALRADAKPTAAERGKVKALLDELAKQGDDTKNFPQVIHTAKARVAEMASDTALSAFVTTASGFLERWEDRLRSFTSRPCPETAADLILFGAAALGFEGVTATGAAAGQTRTVVESTSTAWSLLRPLWRKLLVGRAVSSHAGLGSAVLRARIIHEERADLPGTQVDRGVGYVGTVHQLKGLEADYVVIVALGENRFPYQGTDTPEGRFVWHTALTRAGESIGYLLAEGNGLYLPKAS